MAPSVTAPRLVHEWKGVNIQGQSKDVCLFQLEDSRWGFSQAGQQGCMRTFSSQLYSPAYAAGVVRLFQSSIRENLQRGPLNAASFLPKLVCEAPGAPGVQIALFGRINALANHGSQVEAAWGISDPSDPQTHLIARDPTDMTEAFLKYAPLRNQPHLEEVERNGKRVMEPAKDHYEMHEYLKHFRVEIARDTAAKISRVFLKCVSVLNSECALTEDDWALTLVSSLDCSRGFFSNLVSGGKVGHAMLAYEGMSQQKPVLGYVHFTTDPKEKSPQLKKGKEGQIERFEPNRPLQTVNGRPWRRSRELVENMLAFVDNQKGIPKPFAFLGGMFSVDLSSVGMIFRNEFMHGVSSSSEIIARAEQVMATPESLEAFNREHRHPLSCLDCITHVAEHAGVIFYGHTNATRPLRKIALVLEAPTYQIPAGLHQFVPTEQSLFYAGRSDVVNGMLSACVILTPSDCPPADCAKWAWQSTLEETWATDREIERVESAPIGEIWNGYTPKRWK